MRNPVAAEIFNEAICNLIKRKIPTTLRRSDEFGIAFDYDGSVSLKDSEDILEQPEPVTLKCWRLGTQRARAIVATRWHCSPPACHAPSMISSRTSFSRM